MPARESKIDYAKKHQIYLLKSEKLPRDQVAKQFGVSNTVVRRLWDNQDVGFLKKFKASNNGIAPALAVEEAPRKTEKALHLKRENDRLKFENEKLRQIVINLVLKMSLDDVTMMLSS